MYWQAAVAEKTCSMLVRMVQEVENISAKDEMGGIEANQTSASPWQKRRDGWRS